MRGGQVFMDTLAAHGIDTIFGNPGTTENSLLDRLADYPEIAYYVALHEGVAVSAASFYAQASGNTAVANVHVAPGLGNAIGSIYGALKASSPVIVTAGAQDTRMRLREPLLGHDLVAMAAPVTKWSGQPASADEIGPMLRRAIKIANEAPAGPVFMALPVDVMEQETNRTAAGPGAGPLPAQAPPEALEVLAGWLNDARDPVIVAGDDIARSGAFAALAALAERLGARVYHEGLRALLPFPNRHASFLGRIPFDATSIRHTFGDADLVLLIGGSFFEEVWHDAESPLPPGARIVQMEDNARRLAFNFALDLAIVGALAPALDTLAQALDRGAGVPATNQAATRRTGLESAFATRQAANEARLAETRDATPMTVAWALTELARHTPKHTIVVDESITASLEVGTAFDFQQPGDYYAGRGGGIGQGVAGALGVQIACPDRRVLALSGDGSAMYSIQSLWTAAHHRLPIVFVIVSNREYRVLKHNLDIYRQRFAAPSNKPYPHMDLTRPTLGFTDMARGMGVAGELIERIDEIGPALARAFGAGTPYLLDIVVSGKDG